MTPRPPSSARRPVRPARLALIALAALALLGTGRVAHTAPGPRASAPVRLELYSMSQCPYCAQLVEVLAQVAGDFGPALALSIDYVGTQSEQGELSSMHGPAEVVGDLAQICTARLAPAAHLAMVVCQSRDARHVDTNWESCARDLGVPVERLRRCIQGGEGKRLLAASFERSKSRGVRGTPTIFIAGSQYQGQRGAMALSRAICAAAAAPKPPACQQLPPVPAVNVTILSDRRCGDCNVGRLESRIQNAIANPVVTRLDYADPAGRRLYAAVKPVGLPVVVLDASLDADPDASAQLAWGMRQIGAHRVLSGGGSWNPECADPGGCGRAACRDTLACRLETPGSLELFMMSQCPFAAKALRALPEALASLGGGARLSVHYIGTGDRASGLKSMHGEGEVQEDMRQLCAAKAYPKGFLQYLVCRAGDPRSEDWKACTGPATGIEAEPIERCVKSGEGARLLEQSFRRSEALGVAASPSWIASGRHKFSGIDAATIRAEFCKANAKAKACALSPP